MLPQCTVLADVHPGFESNLAKINDMLTDMTPGKMSDSETETIQIRGLVFYKAFFTVGHPSSSPFIRGL